MAMMPSGVRPSIRLASSPIPLICRVLDSDRGLVEDDPFALDVDEGIGRAKIDSDLVRREKIQKLEGTKHAHEAAGGGSLLT